MSLFSIICLITLVLSYVYGLSICTEKKYAVVFPFALTVLYFSVSYLLGELVVPLLILAVLVIALMPKTRSAIKRAYDDKFNTGL